MRTKKSLGQHFLTNRAVADNIVAAVCHRACVVEVGPGPGILTNRLAEVCDDLILIEKDDRFAAILRDRYQAPQITVVHADFLKVDLADLVGGTSFSLVGNFPYNISSQIVFKMLDYKYLIPEMVGMFQKEMAERIIAGPGSKAYSIIGVLTQTAYTGELMMDVFPHDFDPPPRVTSSVIRLHRKPDLHLPCNERVLRSVVKAAFGQRRKMLRNSLKSLIPSEVMTDDLFRNRPEQVPLETFYQLARLAEAHSSAKPD